MRIFGFDGTLRNESRTPLSEQQRADMRLLNGLSGICSWARGFCQSGALQHPWRRKAAPQLYRTELLEPRAMLAIGLGDAPDTAMGCGAGHYQNLLAGNDPCHAIGSTILRGAHVDGEADAAPSAAAIGDGQPLRKAGTVRDLESNPAWDVTANVNDATVSANPDSSASIGITFNDISETPVLAVNGGSVSFKKKNTTVQIAPNLTLTLPGKTVDSAFGGGQLILSFNSARKKKKEFDSLSLSGVRPVAFPHTFQLIDGRIEHVVPLNPDATVGEIQNALRSITFKTKGKGLKQPSRLVRFQVIDNSASASNVLEQSINVG